MYMYMQCRKELQFREKTENRHFFLTELPCYNPLSHNNPCFQYNIAITNFLVSNTCEIRFHDVMGQSTLSKTILKHG